jgi:hypothetical protein
MSNHSNNLPEELQTQIADSPESTRLLQSGVGNSVKRESFPGRINTVAEKIYTGYNNSHIVLGKDRKNDPWTGYGGRGNSNSGMIHLVAGHFGSSIGLYSEDKNNPSKANPDFSLDSSYIYISQTADIDDYLGLKDGKVGNSIEKSAIAIKADDVRIIGERGIKLVTRRFSQDSKRKNIIKLTGIDLIAGNDDSDLQPIVKGENAIKSLKKMTNLFELLLDTLMEAIYHQSEANSAIANHDHLSNIPGDSTTKSFAMNPKVLKASYVFTEITNKKLDLLRKDLSIFKETYLENTGELYIASRFNNTN